MVLCRFKKKLESTEILKLLSTVSIFCVQAYVKPYFQTLIINLKIFLFESHSRDYSDRFLCQGTSILLRFSCIDAIVEYIFDIYAKNLRIEPYEIQHVIIQLMGCKIKQRRKLH